jgi:Ca2+-binding RTX toxin-like protein
LFGNEGSDKLIGGAGTDFFDGGADADKIDALDGMIDVIVSDPLDGVEADPFNIFV